MTLLKLPVSALKALLGAVMGFGLAKGGSAVRAKTLGYILRDGLFTSLMTPPLALGIHFAIHLPYIA